VPNGVLIPARAEAGGREHRIVFAGRQEARKGLQVLLKVWPELHRRTGARLRVCGADPLAVRLLLTRLRIGDEGIEILGFLSQDDLTAELLSAKALVAPSLGGESFGMVLTRAFACATPVVASDIDGYRDVMTRETSIAVPPTDSEAVAAGVAALLWWRGPDWNIVGDAFRAVQWEWVVAAIALNLLSVVVRSLAWRTVIIQAMPPPHPRATLIFSAFSVGLLANAVLP